MAESTVPRTVLTLSATAALSQTLAAEAEARLAAPLIEIYGSTETGKIATRRTAQSAVWRLVPGVTLRVLTDAQDNEGEPEVWALGGHVEDPVTMSDALELLDDAHFLLHGRKADLINIAGKRSSLACLNHQLCSIPGVADGAFFMPDTMASGDDRDWNCGPVTRLAAFVVAPTLSAADVQRALRERIDAAFMPRPLRFVESLPRNETGKLPHDALALLARRHTRGSKDAAGRIGTPTHSVTFEIPVDHPALPGHFPGRPIVPGVVLLDHAISGISDALERPLDACTISSAKFLSPAMPAVPLELTFRSRENGTIDFTISASTRPVATGTLRERRT
jgi:3-hydroxymyristoyl/3-hydroxydecanoyl-(acyl carrier protein) dehydratase